MASSYWDNLSEREKDWSMFSDYHKSVYGCRPREHEFLNASDERRAEIVQNFERGALDREQAIDWLLQSRDMDRDGLYDGGYNCYLLGLPKSYANELR